MAKNHYAILGVLPTATLKDSYQVAVPLDGFGIPDACPILLFRIDSEDDFEESSLQPTD